MASFGTGSAALQSASAMRSPIFLRTFMLQRGIFIVGSDSMFVFQGELHITEFRRNSIVGQFLQRCLAKDPENRPYPYDLYTFFAGQCRAESAIHFGGDAGTVFHAACLSLLKSGGHVGVFTI